MKKKKKNPARIWRPLCCVGRSVEVVVVVLVVVAVTRRVIVERKIDARYKIKMGTFREEGPRGKGGQLRRLCRSQIRLTWALVFLCILKLPLAWMQQCCMESRCYRCHTNYGIDDLHNKRTCKQDEEND